MKKQASQELLSFVKKIAEKYLKETNRKAISGISEDIKEYISKLVREDLPEFSEEILMMDIEDIVGMVLDFVEVREGSIIVDIQLDQISDLVQSIISMANHNPMWEEEIIGYFESIEVDRDIINQIVINNIKKHL